MPKPAANDRCIFPPSMRAVGLSLGGDAIIQERQLLGAAGMTGSRQMRLGAFMRPVGIHTAWWRYPGAAPDANFNLKHLIRFAQKLEEGRFDAWFMADHLGVLNMPMAALKRSATVTSFDPLTLLPVLAMCTEHLGL